LTANATIRANFTPDPVDPDDGSFLEFVINIMPPGSGQVDVSPNKNLFLQQERVSLTARPNTGFEFDRWDGDDLQGSNPQAVTNVWWHRSIFAHFRAITTGGGDDPPPGGGGDIASRTDTTKIEAEDFTSRVGSFQVTENENGMTNIGWIENGHSATYEVDMDRGGAYSMQFRVANGMIGDTSRFRISVNGTNAGVIRVGNTGDWDTYEIVTLGNDVQIVQGRNTITLNFETAVNVDYFLLLGEQATSSIAARTNAAVRRQVTLRPGIKGFTASLPTNHTYTSYKLVDLQGREVRSGRIGNGVTTLKFDNVRSSVLFLRLEGQGAPTVIRAVTY
jgi:hypothetical protein